MSLGYSQAEPAKPLQLKLQVKREPGMLPRACCGNETLADDIVMTPQLGTQTSSAMQI